MAVRSFYADGRRALRGRGVLIISMLGWLWIAVFGCSLHADDWPSLGRDFTRNSVSSERNPPIDWDVESGRNIKWKADLGWIAFGAPAISDGLVWIGGNRNQLVNGPPDPPALLLCFDEQSGKKLYEYVSPRVGGVGFFSDPQWHGLGSSPLIEGDQLWFVTNRCETVCLDIAPLKADPSGEPRVVWKVDLRAKFGVWPTQPYMGPNRPCSIAPSYQGLIYVSTCNGVDESHRNIPAPDAPALICFDKDTGEAKWQVRTGENILYSELASPLVAEIAGRGQVIMPHGDGWVRSYDPQSGQLLWECDTNLKVSLYTVRGRSNRCYLLATPVLHENRIYIVNGQEAENGEGSGRLLCIDPNKSGDISPELAVDGKGNVVPPRRLQNVDAAAGEKPVPNPNSGVDWAFTGTDGNGNGKVDYEEEMHRSMSAPVIKDGLLYIVDFSGLVHCLNAKTGEGYWNYDMYSQSWESALIVDDKVYVGNEVGAMLVFRHSSESTEGEPDGGPLAEIDMGAPCYVPPIYANGVLYVTTRSTLYAIQSAPPE